MTTLDMTTAQLAQGDTIRVAFFDPNAPWAPEDEIVGTIETMRRGEGHLTLTVRGTGDSGEPVRLVITLPDKQ